jgi:hypothetical protein
MRRHVINCTTKKAEYVECSAGEIAARNAESERNARELAERAADLAKRRDAIESKLAALGLTADDLRMVLG